MFFCGAPTLRGGASFDWAGLFRADLNAVRKHRHHHSVVNVQSKTYVYKRLSSCRDNVFYCF